MNKMKTMILSHYSRLFSKPFWKAFLPLASAALLLFSLEYARYSTFDPKFSLAFCSLSAFSLIVWAFCISLSIRAIGVRKTLPVIVLTLLFLAMDYINFFEYKAPTWGEEVPSGFRKERFYRTYYHAATTAAFFLLLNLYSFCCKSRIVSFARSFLYYLFFLFSLAVIGNALFSGRGLDHDAMFAIMQTDRQEAFHYFFGLNNGLLLLIWLFLVILGLWFFARFAFSPFKDRISRRKRMTGKAAFCCSAAFFVCFMLGGVLSMYHYHPPRMYKVMEYPWFYFNDLKMYNKNRAEYSKRLHERLSVIDNRSCFPGKYVVAIGESCNRNYMGCYGYSKNTTPFQSSMLNDEGFFLFKHPYSCHVQTQRVLLLLLTSLNQYNGKGYEIADATSLIDIAKWYQYQTSWVSGQEKISVSVSTLSPLAESADHVYFSPEPMPYRDLDVLRHLEDGRILDADRSLTFIHMNGNHYPYDLSFPPDTQFDEPDLSLYEQSISFNDRMLSKLFALAQAHDVDVFLFVSDHSDAVSVRLGHDPRFYLQEMAEIPMWVYLSERYRKEHPEIAERLRVATGQVVTNDLCFDLLLELMGMENDFVDPTLVPGNDEYRIDEETARTVFGREHIHVPQG